MRSTTLLTVTLLSTLVTVGCSKDGGGDTMVDPTANTSGEGTSSAGASETGGGTTTMPATSESPTTSAGETAAPTTEAATGFIITPDGGSGGVECDNWAQDCPADQKCMPWADNGGTAWNATKCVPIDADGQAGDECTTMGGAVSGLDSCGLGVMCWDVKPDTMKGTCVDMCKGSQDAPDCPSDTSCFVSNDGVLNLCLPRCDPLAQDCSNENLCIPNPNNDEEFQCVLDASGDNGKTFDPCEFINACDKGFLCAQPAFGSECDPQAIGCCLPFCATDEMAMCPGMDQECIAWYEPGAEPPGLETVGFCGIPMN